MFNGSSRRASSSPNTTSNTNTTSSRRGSAPTTSTSSSQRQQQQQQQQRTAAPHFNMFGQTGQGLGTNFMNYATQQMEQQQVQQAMAESLRTAQQAAATPATSTSTSTSTSKSPPKFVLAALTPTCLDLDDIKAGNENCAICFENQHVGDLAIKLKCGHCFHKECVWPWLQKNTTCPVCRLELDTSTKTTSMGRREEVMRLAHQNNINQRRKQHTQQVADSRRKMQKIQQEEEARQQRYLNTKKYAEKNNEDNNAAVGSPSSKSSPPKKRKINEKDNASTDANEMKEFRSLFQKIGLKVPLVNDLDVALILINNACEKDELKLLKVKELKRRLENLRVDVSTFLDKQSMVDTLSERTNEIVNSSGIRSGRRK